MRRSLLLALTALMIAAGLSVPAAPASAVVVLPGANAAAWPTVWTDYTMASGALITDLNSDMNPTYLDLASGACPAGSPTKCAGPASSVAFTSDGATAFFRMRMAAYDNNSTAAGGLFGGAFLVQVADAAGTLRAVVGVDGTDSSADFVYVGAPGSTTSTVTKVYAYPFTGGSPSSAAMRWAAVGDATGQYYLDFQVPISALTTVSGGAITASTPIKLYFGSSAAAALSTVNKDFMLGDVNVVDFTSLGVIKLDPPVVTFNSQGGTTVASQTLVGSTVTATQPAAPTRAGYVFDGWWTAATGGTSWSFSTTISSDLTLYAQWKPTYTLSFDAQGGSAVSSQTVVIGGTATQPTAPTRTGYTFNGWWSAAAGGTQWIFGTNTVTANTTLYARWTANTYTVAFDLNGAPGTAPTNQTVTHGATASQPTAPTRTGYTFTGWYTAASGGSQWNFGTNTITADTTLYAHWTANTYTVTFDLNGAPGTAPTSQIVTHGATASQPTAPTRTGYTFTGWHTAASGGSQWSFATDPVTSDTTLYARWTKNQYTVTFDSRGGSAVSNQTVTHGANAAQPTAPTRSGYTFAGWYTAASGGTAWSFATDPVTADTTLYARWDVIAVVSDKSNIRVTKSVDDASPRVGDVVRYTLTVTNDGPATAEDVVLTDVLPTGVTLVSADAPCTAAGPTVTCEFGTLLAGDVRTVTVRAQAAAPPPAGSSEQHWIDVQKTEAQLDLEAGQQRTLSVSCAPGYLMTDGSGRIDHVDQGTGTLASPTIIESRAIGLDTWQVTAVNEATGRAQAKVFGLCVKRQTETVNGHSHELQVGQVVSRTTPIGAAPTTTTLSCEPGQVLIQPGFQLDGTAGVPTSYPSGADGWTFVVASRPGGTATTATFTIRCLDKALSTAAGHSHVLDLAVVRQAVVVQPGQVLEATVSCASDAKGIVAGYDVAPGLVNLGNDPRPIIRVFKLFNPTSGPLGADLWLLCLGNRTTGGGAVSPTIVNTATGTTSSQETSTSDNSDTAQIVVDSSVPAAGTLWSAAPSVTVVVGDKVRAKVRCAAGQRACRGRAVLVVARTQRVHGLLVRKGTVLARTSYRVREGHRTTLVLKPTATGRKALSSASLKSARLRFAGTVKIVRLRR